MDRSEQVDRWDRWTDMNRWMDMNRWTNAMDGQMVQVDRWNIMNMNRHENMNRCETGGQVEQRHRCEQVDR